MKAYWVSEGMDPGILCLPY